MAKIKSFTDIDQSKKLAEILPLESADNVIVSFGDRYGVKTIVMPKETFDVIRTPFADIRETTMCWSLAALFGTLTENKICHYNDRYYCQYINEGSEFPIYSTATYDNPIDACYEMILKLNELNIL